MRILAVDPGYTQSAWLLFEGGKPLESGKVANADLLGQFRHRSLTADLMAIEMIASYGMPVGREVFETCLWIGRFIEAWDRRGGKHRLIYRRDVKLHLCNSARATDANVRASLLDRYGPGKELAIGRKAAPGPLYGMKGDQWSALAIAQTVHEVAHP